MKWALEWHKCIDPYAYLADVLRRLPTHPNRQLDELLPHIWQPPQ
ncbi:hypothetical protein ENHY17A_520006 [Moraxellaceae bacterium 17A]|nr:hypothetical protein ENHY17A_520006 [Moraxellaceae bacterium 17A]